MPNTQGRTSGNGTTIACPNANSAEHNTYIKTQGHEKYHAQALKIMYDTHVKRTTVRSQKDDDPRRENETELTRCVGKRPNANMPNAKKKQVQQENPQRLKTHRQRNCEKGSQPFPTKRRVATHQTEHAKRS